MTDWGSPERQERIRLRRAQMIAGLSLRQRVARFWYWYWPPVVTVLVMILVLVGALIWLG